MNLRRALLGLPFLLFAHWVLWPHGHVLLGLAVDAVGVAIIVNPLQWGRKPK